VWPQAIGLKVRAFRIAKFSSAVTASTRTPGSGVSGVSGTQDCCYLMAMQEALELGHMSVARNHAAIIIEDRVSTRLAQSAGEFCGRVLRASSTDEFDGRVLRASSASERNRGRCLPATPPSSAGRQTRQPISDLSVTYALFRHAIKTAAPSPSKAMVVGSGIGVPSKANM